MSYKLKDYVANSKFNSALSTRSRVLVGWFNLENSVAMLESTPNMNALLDLNTLKTK